MKNIEIKSERYETKEKIIELALLGDAIAKLDYKDEKVHYEYSNLKCENGHNISITHDEDGISLTKPSDLIKDLHCDTCNNNFTTSDINIKYYYLYFPKYCYYKGSSHEIKLYCLNCYINTSYTNIGYFTSNNKHNTILSDKNNFSNNQSNKKTCNKCKKSIMYNKQYINDQLQKITIKDLGINQYNSNAESIALLKYNL